jgi:hypothetical protein
LKKWFLADHLEKLLALLLRAPKGTSRLWLSEVTQMVKDLKTLADEEYKTHEETKTEEAEKAN